MARVAVDSLDPVHSALVSLEGILNRKDSATVAKRSGKGRSRRRGTSQKASSGKQQKAFDPEKHFMPPPVPEREYEACPVSGGPITDILTAIADPETGRPSDFNSVIRKLTEQEDLAENERICYLGKGSFGVLVDQKGAKPRYYVRKRIQYEDEYERYPWRKELSPGISRDYVPDPQPLGELYDEAEESIGHNGYGKNRSSIYLPRNE
jgi:hypothetical protein